MMRSPLTSHLIDTCACTVADNNTDIMKKQMTETFFDLRPDRESDCHEAHLAGRDFLHTGAKFIDLS